MIQKSQAWKRNDTYKSDEPGKTFNCAKLTPFKTVPCSKVTTCSNITPYKINSLCNMKPVPKSQP